MRSHRPLHGLVLARGSGSREDGQRLLQHQAPAFTGTQTKILEVGPMFVGEIWLLGTWCCSQRELTKELG